MAREEGEAHPSTSHNNHTSGPERTTTNKMSDDDECCPGGRQSSPTLDLYGPAYARNLNYWKAVVFSSISQGVILGAVSLAFVNYYTAILQATWKSGAYQASLEYSVQGLTHNVLNLTTPESEQINPNHPVGPFLLGHGEWWYFFSLMGAGLGIGLIKCIWSYWLPKYAFPDKIPGFIQEVAELHVDNVLLPIPMLLASGLAIGLGATVGPEAALGASGAGFGTFIKRRWKIGPYAAAPSQHKRNMNHTHISIDPTNDDPPDTSNHEVHMPDESSSSSVLERFFAAVLPDMEDDSMCVIDGMAASFAGLFPAQFLSTLLIHELGNHWGPGGKFAITETVARSGVAATVAYVLYVGVKGYTLLPSIQLPVSFYDVIGEFRAIWIAYGLLLGLISGLVGFLGFLSLAIFGVLGGKVTSKLNAMGDQFGWSGGYVGKLLTPMIGGMIVGALAIAAPLILGDGSEQIAPVLTYSNELGRSTLIVTALLKLVAVGVCLGFGFVGGPFFPILFAGACIGSLMHLLIPDIPLLISYSCCLVGVPAAILPGMFFLTTLASTCFVLGGPATTVVFFTCIVSYNTVCGMG